jgi:hypothetical protein
MKALPNWFMIEEFIITVFTNVISAKTVSCPYQFGTAALLDSLGSLHIGDGYGHFSVFHFWINVFAEFAAHSVHTYRDG